MALLCSRWLAGDVEIVIDGESAGGGVGLIALSEGSAGEERGGEGNEERRGIHGRDLRGAEGVRSKIWMPVGGCGRVGGFADGGSDLLSHNVERTQIEVRGGRYPGESTRHPSTRWTDVKSKAPTRSDEALWQSKQQRIYFWTS